MDQEKKLLLLITPKQQLLLQVLKNFYKLIQLQLHIQGTKPVICILKILKAVNCIFS